LVRFACCHFFIFYHHPLISINSSIKFIHSLPNAITRVSVVCLHFTSVTSLKTRMDITRSRINI
jgi:hypothetical protein